MDNKVVELLEQIRIDFVEKYDGDPLVNRICATMINEYKKRSDLFFKQTNE